MISPTNKAARGFRYFKIVIRSQITDMSYSAPFKIRGTVSQYRVTSRSFICDLCHQQKCKVQSSRGCTVAYDPDAPGDNSEEIWSDVPENNVCIWCQVRNAYSHWEDGSIMCGNCIHYGIFRPDGSFQVCQDGGGGSPNMVPSDETIRYVLGIFDAHVLSLN